MADKAPPTNEDYRARAESLAKLAHESHMESRGGLWPVRDLDCHCYFNNTPVEQDGGRRDRELKAFRDTLFENGVVELARASYPTEGDSAGYTVTMLIDVAALDWGEAVSWLEDCGLPVGPAGLRLIRGDLVNVHVLIGGIPFGAKDVEARGMRPGFGTVVLAENVGDPAAILGDFYADTRDPACRYFPAGSVLVVRWEDDPHPSTDRRQGTIVEDIQDAMDIESQPTA